MSGIVVHIPNPLGKFPIVAVFDAMVALLRGFTHLKCSNGRTSAGARFKRGANLNNLLSHPDS